MDDVEFLSAIARQEGGVVALTIVLSSSFDKVRILRKLSSDPAPADATDETDATVVWDNTMLECPPDLRRLHLSTPPTTGTQHYIIGETENVGAVWDFQAFYTDFQSTENLIDTSPVTEWTYYVYPYTDAGLPTYGTVKSVTITPQRRVQAALSVDVKNLVFQRLSYHASQYTEENVEVTENESIGQDPILPRVLNKIRYNLTEHYLGRSDVPEGIHTNLRYNAVSDILIITPSPNTRDEVGEYFHTRLLGDKTLFEYMGLQEVRYSTLDNFREIPMQDIWYTMEITISAYIDATIISAKDYVVDDIIFLWTPHTKL